MNQRQTELALERQRLQLESARLRDALAQQSDVLFSPPAKVFDAAAAGLRWGRNHPLHLAVAAGALLLFKPVRTVRWAYASWRWWRHARRWYDWIGRAVTQRWPL